MHNKVAATQIKNQILYGALLEKLSSQRQLKTLGNALAGLVVSKNVILHTPDGFIKNKLGGSSEALKNLFDRKDTIKAIRSLTPDNSNELTNLKSQLASLGGDLSNFELGLATIPDVLTGGLYLGSGIGTYKLLQRLTNRPKVQLNNIAP